ncbi:unnamed protein product [Penicillium viridicatum]
MAVSRGRNWLFGDPSKLMSDARVWLSKSNGDVQMVITIKIGRSLPNIVLESWELVDDRVKCQQGRNNSVYVDGQPLVIRFDKLFLRSPAIRRETDISFHSTMLNKIARDSWEEQEL